MLSAWTTPLLAITAFLVTVLPASASHFGIYGSNSYSGAGGFIGSAGDVNNDGILDMIVCPSSPSWPEYTIAYVIYGTATGEDDVQEGLLKDVDLASFNSSQGFRILRNYKSVIPYCSAASALGDVNGDGIDDIAIAQASHGAFVVFGRSGPMADIVDLSTMPAGVGIKLSASRYAYEFRQYTVARAGDVNGDGMNDIIIGAPLGRYAEEGRVFVVFGGPTLASTNLTHMPLTTGYTIFGARRFSAVGSAVGSADINGDGLSDVIVSEIGPMATAFVLFGCNSTFGRNTFLNSSFDGFRVTNVGERFSDPAWLLMSVLGDVNGDGLADFMIKSNAYGAGSVARPFAVVFGKTTMTDIDLSNLDLSHGFHIRVGDYPSDDQMCGIDEDVQCCYIKGAADGVLDYNGDGFADIAVAVSCNAFWSKKMHPEPFVAVIFGGSSLQETDLSFLDDDASNGFRVWGGPGFDTYGASSIMEVSSVGMTSDGYSGLMVAALYSNPYGRDRAGAISVYFGRNTTAGDLMVISPPQFPTRTPTPAPTAVPTSARPSENPSFGPTEPTQFPSFSPSEMPSLSPTIAPSAPTFSPSYAPTAPTQEPSSQPSIQPTGEPTGQPSSQPVQHPSSRPSRPTMAPTVKPSRWPTVKPTKKPTTSPSKRPSVLLSSLPTVVSFSETPSALPTVPPSVSGPSTKPTWSPSVQPSKVPTVQPTLTTTAKTSKVQSLMPVMAPSVKPTKRTVVEPTVKPTKMRTSNPTVRPTRSPTFAPFKHKSKSPSMRPTKHQEISPTRRPTKRNKD